MTMRVPVSLPQPISLARTVRTVEPSRPDQVRSANASEAPGQSSTIRFGDSSVKSWYVSGASASTTICVEGPSSLRETLFTVAPNAGAAARRIVAASAANPPARRGRRIELVTSSIVVTLFGFQLDRQRLGFAEGVLDDLQLALRDPGDVPVQNRVSDAQHVAVSAAVFHQRELVRGAPHDAHEVNVAHVHERSVARRL